MRKVFFSFHYTNDNWRAAQVRNSNIIQRKNIITSEFVDSVKWETIKKQGEENIKRWINEQLKNTSVTVVLIGSKTSERKWVKYEIDQSIKRGNGLVGVYIHNIKDRLGKTSLKGKNPFENLYFERGGKKVFLSEIYLTYDWLYNNGRENLGEWIEQAANK